MGFFIPIKSQNFQKILENFFFIYRIKKSTSRFFSGKISFRELTSLYRHQNTPYIRGDTGRGEVGSPLYQDSQEGYWYAWGEDANQN